MPSGATVQLSARSRDDLGIVLAVELHEQRVVRRDRVDERERGAAVAVVVRRLGDDAEVERAARAWASAPRRRRRPAPARRPQPRHRRIVRCIVSLRFLCVLQPSDGARSQAWMHATEWPGRQLARGRHGLAAFLRRQRAARMEDAALGRVERARQLALDDGARPRALDRPGRAPAQRPAAPAYRDAWGWRTARRRARTRRCGRDT